MERCTWATNTTEEMKAYHDDEWGRPVHEEQQLFELLTLESMQAGLSWAIILNKRETLRAAYDAFDYRKIARYDEEKILALLANPGVIRHRLKIQATITNAQFFQEIQAEFGSFDRYLWNFVDQQPIVNHWQRPEEVPASTELSQQISRALKKRGFKFLGATTVYSFLQAAGLVNDHLETCHYK
ncbi:DNA-3-methyladenine glycosylase I [Enterococcus faecalis]|uniref:DNA-3-methyladenine glycosylase I n=1 Tax=Enterococcus faecalis TaxID=1351 RepID=UPI0035DFF28D